MLTLPSKPWKRVEAIDQGNGRYLLRIASKLRKEADFVKMIQQDFTPCLRPGDDLLEPNWHYRSIVLITKDFRSFQRRLILKNVMVEREKADT